VNGESEESQIVVLRLAIIMNKPIFQLGNRILERNLHQLKTPEEES